MRRPILAAGVAGTVIALAGIGDVLAKEVKIPNRSKLEKQIARLVGGEVDVGDNVGRAKVLAEIDKILAKDKKGVTLRSPQFWAEAIQKNSFADRKSAKTKKVTAEEMVVVYADESARKVPIVWHGAAGYQNKTPAKLVVTLLPKGTDAKAWLEANWKADETASKNWITAAVAESDQFPVADQPFLMAYAFGHMLAKFNVAADHWYLEGVGDACVAVQKVASEGMPGRLSGLILRDPKSAVTNANSSRFATYVLAEAATNEVGAKYQEINAERNVVATKGEGAIAALAAWIENNPGRTLPASYDWVTATEEERVIAPWTGSLFLVSPAKRGEPAEFKVTYDMEANSISIDGKNVGEFKVYMNDDLVNLDNEITISCNGKAIETRKFERDLKEIFDTADNWGEYGHIFTASYRGFAPAEIAAPEEGEGEGGDKEGGDEGGE